MSQCPFGGDGEFSFERFADVYNSGLANNLGNLYSRILTMCVKYFDGRLGGADGGRPDRMAARARLRRRSSASCASMIGSFEYSAALQRIWLRGRRSRPTATSRRPQPFKLAKTDLEACRAVLVNLAEWLRVAAILIKPFLPRTAETFYGAFNFGADNAWDRVSYSDATRPLKGLELADHGTATGGKPAPLFPKIETRKPATG